LVKLGNGELLIVESLKGLGKRFGELSLEREKGPLDERPCMSLLTKGISILCDLKVLREND